jgi:uridine phosphorylase
MVKIIDETDNLYGFNMASGVPEVEWGKSVFASPKIIDALRDEAVSRHLPVEKRICHHLENYHSLRSPEKFSPDRTAILQKHLQKFKRSDKKESLDMESAVLFRVAKDFGKHAASVLQTVDKENSQLGPYEGDNKKKAIMLENRFVEYILSALLRIDPREM